jgi:hypothetical protein
VSGLALAAVASTGCGASESVAGRRSGEPPTAVRSARSDSGVARAGPVAIRGTVVDAATGAGIASAIVIVLRPGVAPEEWARSRGAEATAALMEAAAVTDQGGAYQIANLARGAAYTVMVTAAGYEPAVFDAGLALTTRDPEVTAMGAVGLERS